MCEAVINKQVRHFYHIRGMGAGHRAQGKQKEKILKAKALNYLTSNPKCVACYLCGFEQIT
jgi:hypothetical protein